MDSSKLRAVIRDIELDEETLKLNDCLQTIITDLERVSRGEQTSDGSNSPLADFHEKLKGSLFFKSGYPVSNKLIIKTIGAEKFVATGLEDAVRSAIQQPGPLEAQKNALERLMKNRRAFLTTLRELAERMSKIGIEPSLIDSPEIGICIDTDGKNLEEVSKAISVWSEVIAGLNRFTKSKQDLAFKRVSNECIQLDLLASPELQAMLTYIIQNLGVILEEASRVYEAIERLRTSGIDPAILQGVKESHETQIEVKIGEITSSVTRQITNDDGRTEAERSLIISRTVKDIFIRFNAGDRLEMHRPPNTDAETQNNGTPSPDELNSANAMMEKLPAIIKALDGDMLKLIESRLETKPDPEG
jgi:hypothetical protein